MTSNSKTKKKTTVIEKTEIEESPVVIEKTETTVIEDPKESDKEVEEKPLVKIKQSLLDYARLWNEEIYTKSSVTPAIGKKLVEYYNDYFNDNKRFTGCGTCLITIQKKLYVEAKKFNLVK